MRALRHGVVLSGVLLLTLLAAGAIYGLVDENLAVDSWTYSVLRELELRGHPLSDFGLERPYALDRIAAAIRDLRRDVQAGRVRLSVEEGWLLDALEREFETEIEVLASSAPGTFGLGLWVDGRYARDEEGENRERARVLGEMALRLGSRITLYQRSILDTRPEEDPSVVAVPWRGNLAGVTDPAYVVCRTSRWRLLFGRERLDWGSGFFGGLVVSSQAVPLEMARAEVQFSRFRGTAFTAVLDGYTDPETSGWVSRYLSGHRLAWRPKPSFEIAATEVIVYGGEGRLPEVRYLLPLFFFYAEQWNAGIDDNPLWAFDLSWRPRPGMRIYGEYLIDDFQYDFATEPHETGFVVGTELADPPGLRGGVLGLEYARVNRWTYGQNVLWNRYVNHGVGVGHPLGPDADGLWVRAVRQVAPTVRVHLDLARIRRGEGRIEDERSSAVPFEDRFPSGVVETGTGLTCAVEWFPSGHTWFFGQVGWARRVNAGHIEGAEGDELTASLRCRLGVERLWSVR